MSDSPRNDKWAELSITVLYSGYAPFASGSWGSLMSLILYAIPAGLLFYVIGPAAGQDLTWAVESLLLVPGIALSILLSIWWGDWALEKFGAKDPKPFVLDEFAGQWIALVALPLAATNGDLLSFGALLFSQLFLFRVFDVLKVPPAAQLEGLPSGWGVLCDDLMAGVYANVVGQVIWRFTPLAATLGIAPGIAGS